MIIDPSECTDTTCDCTNKKWWTGWVGQHVHVVPVNDTHEHTTRNCPCAPVTEIVVTDDGRHGFGVWHTIHNAHDGRD